ncbi:high frequency lysogenization protein HflD [Halioxenophilus sp. WMMB6]|uniref:high frequency lysogenization protein HflD n=1 Tax=Halioxenophilus sp. WMMB6 TaxID=3073815 RepID=UPI00295E86C5|nr:high frequency lysogenization protein HflD [Halioxenophilus sp. WMMB6]
MSEIYDQTLALAGVFQAVALVEALAKTGTCNKQSFKACISSVFVTDPKDTLAVFGDTSNLALGLKVVIEYLQGHSSKTSPDGLRYALSLLHLQKKLSRNPAMLAVISKRLSQCQQQLDHFDICHENVIANLAGIYSDTLSTYPFRIQVRGGFNQLQQPRIANQIRALLLAGIRSTILWRQVGGSRVKLLWQKKKLQACAEQLYREIDNQYKL